MSMLACHVRKFGSSGVHAMQSHHQREYENSSNADIDPERTHLNYDLHNAEPINYSQRVNEIIEEGYTGEKKIRSDAVKLVGIIVTAEKEFFDKLGVEETKEFFKESLEFIKAEYGEKNIVSAVVHMDEKTPHLHASIVPLTQDGRLSGKDLFDKYKLIKLQDKFPQHLKRFGIERGRVKSDDKHLKPEEYKKQQLHQLKEDNKLYDKYAPCYDKVEEAYNSATKNLIGGKYSIPLDKLKYLHGAARQGLGSNYNTDQRDQTIKQLEASVEYHKRRAKDYPALERKVQEIEKVLDSNPDLKKQFNQQSELEKQKRLQQRSKSTKRTRR